MRKFQKTRILSGLAFAFILHCVLDASAASAVKSKPASAPVGKKAAQAPQEPSLCSEGSGSEMTVPQKQLVIPGYSDDQSDGLVSDSHQKPVMISILTKKQAEQLAKQLRRHHAEMGGLLNRWAAMQVCDQRAYLMECFAQNDCSISLGRIFIKKPIFPLSFFSSMKILNRDYTATIKYHTASLVYILDDNNQPILHVIDPFANGDDDRIWTGAYTPVRYDTWTREKIQAEKWNARFVPRFSAWGQLEDTNAQPNVSDKCSQAKIDSIRNSFGPLVHANTVMNAGSVR